MKHVGDREVSFIDREVKEWLEENRDSGGLCLGRFRADFVIAGLAEKKVGDIVEAGGVDELCSDAKSCGMVAGTDDAAKSCGVSYEITQIGKKCFVECELLTKLGKKCPLADGVAFGKTRG